MPITAAEFRELLRDHAAAAPADPDRRDQVHRRIRRVRRRRAIGAGAATVAAVLAVILVAGQLLGRHGSAHTAGPTGRTTATLVPYPAAGAPTAAQLDADRTILLRRFADAGLPTPTITARSDGSLALAVAGSIPLDRLEQLTAPGLLSLRPVHRITGDDSGVTSVATDPPGRAAPTLADVEAKVGTYVYNLAVALVSVPPQASDAATTFAAFATLTPDEVAVLPANVQFFVPTIGCAQLNARDPSYVGGPDHLAQPVVACDTPNLGLSQSAKYLLDPAPIGRSGIARTQSDYDLQNEGGWYVTIEFTPAGQAAWRTLTREQTNNQVAITLDASVLSAPLIKEEINGPAVINGSSGIDKATTEAITDLLHSAPLPVGLGVTGYATHK